MAVSAIPGVISTVSSLLNQPAAIRQAKLNADVQQAQIGNSLADQSYLMYLNRVGNVTRYEYDKLAGQYITNAGPLQSLAAMRSSGLFTDSYLASVARNYPGVVGSSPMVTTVPPPPGSSVLNPVQVSAAGFAGLPAWAIPVAGGALLLMLLRRR